MCRITGRMDTRYRPLERTGCLPGDRPVSWQAGMLERGDWLTFELRNIPCRSSSKFSYTCKLSKARPSPKRMSTASSRQVSSRTQWILGSHEDSEKRLFVFRTLEISNRTHRVGSKPLISGIKQVRDSARSWRATCKTRLLYANCIQQCERKPRSKVRADFIKTLTNFRLS